MQTSQETAPIRSGCYLPTNKSLAINRYYSSEHPAVAICNRDGVARRSLPLHDLANAVTDSNNNLLRRDIGRKRLSTLDA